MYWKTALALLVLWILGFVVLRAPGPWIHILLAGAVILLLWHLRVGDRNPL
jgi:hypothetical protein